MDKQATDEELRTLAYRLWEQAGCPDGRADEFWEQARAHLSLNSSPTPVDRMNDSDEFVDAPDAAGADTASDRSGR